MGSDKLVTTVVRWASDDYYQEPIRIRNARIQKTANEALDNWADSIENTSQQSVYTSRLYIYIASCVSSTSGVTLDIDKVTYMSARRFKAETIEETYGNIPNGTLYIIMHSSPAGIEAVDFIIMANNTSFFSKDFIGTYIKPYLLCI